MARTLTGSTATKAAQKLGTEPIILVKLEWGGTIGTQYYADKDLTIGTITADGWLQSFGSINTQTKDNGVGTISTVSVILDDTGGALKTAMETVAPEGVVASVYHHYAGLGEADLVYVMKGKVASPITWSEAERVFSFDISSEVEAKNVGFAPDENDVPTICDDAKGQPWPLVFGQVRHLPTVKAVCSARGYLKTRASDRLIDFSVDGGNNFPQATNIDLSIGGTIYEGTFTNELFNVLVANKPIDTNVLIADRTTWALNEDYDNPRVCWIQSTSITLAGKYCFMDLAFNTAAGYVSRTNYCYKQEGKKCYFSREWTDGDDVTVLLSDTTTYSHGYSILNTKFSETTTTPREEWGTDLIWKSGLGFRADPDSPTNTYLWTWRPGSLVLQAGVSDVYIANLTTSAEVLEVRGEKSIPGQDKNQLVPIPEDWYTVDLAYALGGKTTTAIIIPIPLEERKGQGWTGKVYVTVNSTIGANTASDVLDYLLTNYTNLTVDATTLASVASDIANYPSNFALTKTGDALAIIQEIAWQARIGVRIEAGIVSFKYLSEEPVSGDFTVDESEIELKSVVLSFTEIESVYTHLTAKWREDYSGDKERTNIYENNIDAYGTRERELDFYIYPEESLVLKSLEFWGRRWSNIWRRVQLKTFLTTLKLELFDDIQFSLTDTTLIPPDGIRGRIDTIDHDPNDNSIMIACTLPSKAGTIIASSDFWEDDSGDVAPDAPGLGVVPETEDNQMPGTHYTSSTSVDSGGGDDSGSSALSELNVGTTDATDVTDDVNTVSLRDALRIVETTPGVFALALDVDNLYFYSSGKDIYARVTDLVDLDTVGTRVGAYLNIVNAKIRSGANYGSLDDLLTMNANKLVIKSTADVSDGSNVGVFNYKWNSSDGKWYPYASFLG